MSSDTAAKVTVGGSVSRSTDTVAEDAVLPDSSSASISIDNSPSSKLVRSTPAISQSPLASEVATNVRTVASISLIVIVTILFGSAVPVSVSAPASLEFAISLTAIGVSMVGVVIAVSMVTSSDGDSALTLPASSLRLYVRLGVPSTSPDNVTLTLPSAFAVVAAASAPSTNTSTVAPASTLPAGKATSIVVRFVTLSVSLVPVSLDAIRSSAVLGSSGAVRSTINSFINVSLIVLPAASITVTSTS